MDAHNKTDGRTDGRKNRLNMHVSSQMRAFAVCKERPSVPYVGRKHANYFSAFVCVFWTIVHISFELMSSKLLILSERHRRVAAVVVLNDGEQK